METLHPAAQRQPFTQAAAGRRFSFQLPPSADFSFAAEDRRISRGQGGEALHWHDYFEIEVIYGGRGVHVYNGSPAPIGRGSVFLLTPADFHAVVPEGDAPLELLHLRFDERAVPTPVLRLLLEREGRLTATLADRPFSALLQDCGTLLDDCRAQPPLLAILLQADLARLCALLLQTLDPPAAPAAQGPLHPAVQEAIWQIRCNFRKKLTLQDLSRRAHLSPNHFGQLFRRELGLSCSQYLLNLRLHYAVNLLRHTALSVEEVAVESGFASPSYFISVFRRTHGVTPRAYQAGLRPCRD